MKKKIIVQREYLVPGIYETHANDLKKSGLSEGTIKRAGIVSVSRERMEELLGFRPFEAESGLMIPYPRMDFFRIKLFPFTNGEEEAD
jgi:hypothetical protein